ncbi:MAG: RNA-binding protein [Elusimicrobia bacterium]|nr:RNA-binding protein [Elusimicrobiota bacterium]
MTTNLFVGGLSYETTQDELEKLFAACGKVAHVKLIMDRETGRSKGFGFVEMATEAEAAAALKKLSGATLGGRQIFVNEARPKEERPDAAGPKPAFVPGPGFVERRSGKDRRKAGGFGAPKSWAAPSERRESFGDKPRWSDKPKWGDKPRGFGPKKFGDKPKWADKPGGFGPKKFGDKPKWADKPGGFGPKKFGKKPGGFRKRP